VNRRQRVLRGAACLGVALCCRVAAAAAADDPAAQRQRIAQERAAAAVAHQARVAECEQRFVVTSCVKASQRALRDALDRLRQQQMALDEAQRKQRAAERVDAISRKLAADEAQRPPVIGPAASANLTLREQKARAPGRTAAGEPKAASTRQEQQRSSRQLQQSRRQAELRAHRESVEQRNAERRASGKAPAAPLPVPSTLPALPAGSAPR